MAAYKQTVDRHWGFVSAEARALKHEARELFRSLPGGQVDEAAFRCAGCTVVGMYCGTRGGEHREGFEF